MSVNNQKTFLLIELCFEPEKKKRKWKQFSMKNRQAANEMQSRIIDLETQTHQDENNMDIAYTNRKCGFIMNKT